MPRSLTMSILLSTISEFAAVDADLLEHAVDRVDLRLGFRIGRVDDVQQEVGVPRLFERRAERGHQVVRQVADKPDRVAQQDFAPFRQLPAASSRVERGKQLVGDVDLGAGERVHQRALARIRVADDRDGHLLAAGRNGPLAAFLDFGETLLEFGNPPVDEPAVGFDLRFARTTAGADAALDALEVAPPPAQPIAEVLQLGQLDLQTGLVGAGPAGEDVENHLAAIDDDPAGLFFEVSALGGGETVVEDDQVGPARIEQQLELFELSLSQAGGRNHLAANLGHPAHDLDAGRFYQPGQFVQGVLPTIFLSGIQDGDQHRLCLLDTQLLAFRISRQW